MDWEYNSLVLQAYDFKTLRLYDPYSASVLWADDLLIADGRVYDCLIGVEKVSQSLYTTKNKFWYIGNLITIKSPKKHVESFLDE